VDLSMTVRAAVRVPLMIAYARQLPMEVTEKGNIQSDDPIIYLGHASGSGTCFWGSSSKPRSSSLSELIASGVLYFGGPGKDRLQFSAKCAAASDGSIGPGADGWLEEGEVCPDGTWRGKGKLDLRTDVLWSLKFKPDAPPPHVTAHMNQVKLWESIDAGEDAYGPQLFAEWRRIVDRLHKEGRHAEGTRLMQAGLATVNTCSVVKDFGSVQNSSSEFVA
jgi:hypothetical protein